MSKRARDVMTVNPALCTPDTSLDRVARLMVQHDCGEIPVVDAAEQVVGAMSLQPDQHPGNLPVGEQDIVALTRQFSR